MYNKTTWLDHIVQFPDRYTITENGDGTVTIARAEGAIVQQGTPVSATNLQNMEDEIERMSALVDQQQATIDSLNNRVLLIESTFPDNFTNNLFSEDLSALDAVKVTKGYYNEAQTRLEV